MDNKEILQRILLIGDSKVGKSSILERYICGNYQENYKPSKGIDYKSKFLDLVDGNKIKFQIWDTSGHERFLSIIKTYFKAANGFILIYDITNEESFFNLSNWIADIKKETIEPVPIILVGNKIDDDKNRKIKKKEGVKFSKNNGLLFYECSAKSGKNVENIFNEIIKKINEKNPNFIRETEKYNECYIY